MIRSLVSFAFAGLVVSVFAANQVGCSSKTCSTSEEQACTSTYNDCVTKAAAMADKAACQKCVDDYCTCYNACGNSCDKAKLASTCQ